MNSQHAAEKEQLQKELKEWQSRYWEKDRSLSALQYRYESRTSELHKIRQERDNLEKSKNSTEKRTEKFQEDVTKLKEERTQLKKELEEARQELKNGGGSLADTLESNTKTHLTLLLRLEMNRVNSKTRMSYSSARPRTTQFDYEKSSMRVTQSLTLHELKNLSLWSPLAMTSCAGRKKNCERSVKTDLQLAQPAHNPEVQSGPRQVAQRALGWTMEMETEMAMVVSLVEAVACVLALRLGRNYVSPRN